MGACGLTASLLLGGLLGLARPAGAATCSQAGSAITCTFTDTGAAETFVVPAGVVSAQITAQGGSGGHGSKPPQNPTAQGGDGGGGGIARATVPLTPGTTLHIYVGGKGGDGELGESACPDGAQGGAGGLSGGIKTGGDGGDSAVNDSSDQGCVGGGGGGGTFVMPGGATPGSATPLLAAGGGGGGGGGSGLVGGSGGHGGGNGNGATAGGAADDGPAPGPDGGQPGASASVAGTAGAPGDGAILNADDGGGGGGGGYPGGTGGGRSSGGGGGAGRAPAGAVVGSASPGTSGTVTITYSLAGTARCTPDDQCAAQPVPGEETKFKVVASGGDNGATLFATLNGGLPPACKSVGGDLSPDWVQFGFLNPKDGRTWSKRIRVTGTDPTSKSTAQHILAETQICFAAPYTFVVKRGTQLARVGKNWEGLLAHCESDIVAEAKRDHPRLARPCILGRSLVKKGDGWVVRVSYFVPDGQLDPQGRSLRKKRKHRH